MLTDKDVKVLEKSIRKIVREEVETEGENIRSELGGDIKSTNLYVRSELRAVSDRLKNIEIKTSKVEKEMTTMKKDIKYLKKEQKHIVDFFDKDHIGLVKRVRRVEDHLDLPEIN